MQNDQDRTPPEHGTWEIESTNRNASSQGLLVLFGIVGAVLIALGLRMHPTTVKEFAPVLLGILLLVVGAAGFLFSGEVTVKVDTHARRLVVRTKSRFASQLRIIGFGEVANVRVQSVGNKAKSGFQYYVLKIDLKRGETINTLHQSFDSSEVNLLAEKLAADIGCQVQTWGVLPKINAAYVLASLISGVVIYALWFRLYAGPWCPAMWHGSAPIAIIAAGFALSLGTFRSIMYIWSRRGY